MRNFQLNIIGRETLTLSSLEEIKTFYKNNLTNYYQEKFIAGVKKGQPPINENDYVKFYDNIFTIPLKGEQIRDETVNYCEIKFNSDENMPYLLINIYMNENRSS